MDQGQSRFYSPIKEEKQETAGVCYAALSSLGQHNAAFTSQGNVTLHLGSC